MESGFYTKVWQAYAAVGDDKAVGVVGDERRYVQLKLSQKLSPQQIQLMKLIQLTTVEFEQKITNEIEELTVKYISSKPPATIEWE